VKEKPLPKSDEKPLPEPDEPAILETDDLVIDGVLSGQERCGNNGRLETLGELGGHDDPEHHA
jgi:hypothetical protein